MASAKADSVDAVTAATWTPHAAGPVARYAAYASSDGTAAATSSAYELTATYNHDTNTKESTSKAAATPVTETGSNVALSVSTTTLAIGVPAAMTAAITPSTSTSMMTFSAMSTVLGAGTVANGKAGLAWKPSATGGVALTASFIRKGENKPAGSDTLKVTVARSLPGGTLSLGPTGQPAWPPNASHPMRYRTRTSRAGTVQSGGTLALAVAGPCDLAGMTITAAAGAAPCTLTERSPGASSLASVSQSYAIVLAR